MPEFSPMLAITLIIALGASAQWLAWRISIPAILPLLIVGFLVGPILGLLKPSELIGRDILFPAVSLAVGLILFEGGMTLRIPEIREIRRVVFNLVTVGALVTWVGATAAAYFIVGLDFPLALLFGSLIIVTGPTVIMPLLRIVRPKTKTANVLKWEGILIDPIGVLVAVLVFEFLLIENRSEALSQTLVQLFQFVLVGGLMGVVGGYFMAAILRRHLIPHYLVNFSALAIVFGVFALSHALAHESGLLATVIMGMIVANLGVPNIRDILSFKEDMTILFLSLLFVVLAADVELAIFVQVLSWPALLLLLTVMLIVRPLTVLISTLGSSLTFREKLFVSWIGPRGIVTAAVTSLFAARLVDAGITEAELLVPLVFLIIVGTVTVSSLTARPLATLLGVAEPDSQGFLILGAHDVGRRIGALLQDEGFKVVLADTNGANVSKAQQEGFDTYYGSLLSDHSEDELQLSGIGHLLALTSNDEANALTALKYAYIFDPQRVYQLEPGRSDEPRGRVGEQQRGLSVFYGGTTFTELSERFKGGELVKTPVTPELTLEALEARYGKDVLPMFVIRDKPKGKDVKPVTSRELELSPETVLVTLAPASTRHEQRQGVAMKAGE